MNDRRVVNAPSTRWLYGINAVRRRLEARPDSIVEVRLSERPSSRRSEIAQLARAAGRPVKLGDEGALRRLTGTTAHQGVAALAGPYEYAELPAIAVGGELLVLLDQIQDPHNLGALVRTAAAVRASGVIIPRHGSAPVSAAVEKVAAGAVNDVPICRVANVRRAVQELRAREYWSIALQPDAKETLFEIDLPERVALVIGGESGLRPLVARESDRRVSIPCAPPIDSLNASVAGAIAMYEVVRRRLDTGKRRW